MIHDIGIRSEVPDPRSPAQRAADLPGARNQAQVLIDFETDTGIRPQLLEWLLWRRAELRLPAVDVYRPGADAAWLLARGDLLCSAAAALRDGLVEYLTGAGYIRQGVDEVADCLDGRLVRYRNPERDVDSLVDDCRHLQGLGYECSVSYLSPCQQQPPPAPTPKPGVVVKAGSTPDPTVADFPRPATGEPPAAVTVAVIDTGIPERERGDGWLSGITRSPGNIDPLYEVASPGYLTPSGGHGAFVAGVVQQVAPEVSVRMYRPFATDGLAADVDVACAIVRAAREGATVINLSCGTTTLADEPPLAFETALDVIDRLPQDVLLIASAGNGGTTDPVYPAACRRVVSVAGLRSDLSAASWSSRGFWVDCAAVAEGIVSTYVEGTENPRLDKREQVFPPDAWAMWTGTSFAAPQITGAVAHLCAQTGMSPRVALRRLLDGAPRVPGYGRAVRLLPGT